MKLVTYMRGDAQSFGAVVGERVADLGARFDGRYADLKALLAADGLDDARRALAAGGLAECALAEVTLLPPVPNPDKIVCIGLNYDTHRRESGRPEAEHPTIFTRFANTQMGHEAPVWVPRVSDRLDYEGELAVVIGRSGRYIPAADALAHVAGYACYNDASVRDWQRHTHQFTPGKNFPHTGAFGPWLVTADEIPDPSALTLTTRLNGAVMQEADTSLLIFPVPDLIAYISTFTELAPGDVIPTGTPGGVGFKREPPVFMKPGDRVEVEISGIGVLGNPVEPEPVP